MLFIIEFLLDIIIYPWPACNGDVIISPFWNWWRNCIYPVPREELQRFTKWVLNGQLETESIHVNIIMIISLCQQIRLGVFFSFWKPTNQQREKKSSSRNDKRAGAEARNDFSGSTCRLSHFFLFFFIYFYFTFPTNIFISFFLPLLAFIIWRAIHLSNTL